MSGGSTGERERSDMVKDMQMEHFKERGRERERSDMVKDMQMERFNKKRDMQMDTGVGY